MGQLIIETKRILGCTWQDDDLPLLLDLHSTSKTSGYIMGEKPWNIEKASLKLTKYREEHDRDGTGKYKLIHKESGSFIGRAGVSVYDAEASEYELGYVLKEDWWEQGLATEIAAAMAAKFFSLKLSNRLLAFSDDWNRPSHRVLEKIGMKLAGRRNVGGSQTLMFTMSV